MTPVTRRKAEGFAGQRIQVLAAKVAREAAARPGTASLLVTDCGYYPEASGHFRRRLSGAEQAIIIVCVRGQGWCELAGARHTIVPGQVLLIPPRLAHSYGADDANPWTIWWAHITGADVAGLLKAVGASTLAPVQRVSDVDLLATIVNQALSHMEKDSSPSTLLAAAGCLWHLVAALPSLQISASRSSDPIRSTLHYLASSVGTSHSVEELAHRVALSRSHFAALFRKRTGMGVHEYQVQLRMNRARTLLDSTDQPIAAVARRAGYTDPLHFSRQFRSHHGMSPTEYRASAKG